jgi:hypothetical protein
MGVVNSFSRIGGLISPFFAVALVQVNAVLNNLTWVPVSIAIPFEGWRVYPSNLAGVLCAVWTCARGGRHVCGVLSWCNGGSAGAADRDQRTVATGEGLLHMAL